jgi:carbon monoxide dehydrogenase subunit G
MRVDVTVDISAPPEVVWAVLSDVESWPAWTASISSVRPSSPDSLQVGSRVRIKQPRLPATVWTVSDFVERERFTWTATSPGVKTRASHRVVRTAEGSRATLSIDQAGILGRLVGRLYGGLTRRYVEMEAAGLKQRSEESASQTRR